MSPVLILMLVIAVAVTVLCVALVVKGALTPVRRAMTLVVTHRQDHPNDWFTLRLQRPWWARWRPLPGYAAGQSVAVSLPGKKLSRRYSLARWRRVPFAYEITVKPEPGGKLSNALKDAAKRHGRVVVQHPSGVFVLGQGAGPLVFIAGGVGITPLVAMLDQGLKGGIGGREVHFYWQVRHPHEWVYERVLKVLCGRRAHIRLHLLASAHPETPSRLTIDRIAADLPDLAAATVYMCASGAMMDAFEAALHARGVPHNHIRFERFGVGGGAGDTGRHAVTFRGQDIVFDGHRTLLDAIEDAGITLPADCRAGSCGQCQVRVIDGQVRRLIPPEVKVEAGCELACCCVPETALQLA